MSEVLPLEDRVIVEEIELEGEQKYGSLYIPDNAKEKPSLGIVVAVGPGKRLDGSTDRAPLAVEVGWTVAYGKYSGTTLNIDGRDVLFLRESDLLGVVVVVRTAGDGPL